MSGTTLYEGHLSLRPEDFAEARILLQIEVDGEWALTNPKEIIGSTLGRFLQTVANAEGYCTNLDEQVIMRWVMSDIASRDLFVGAVQNPGGREGSWRFDFSIDFVVPIENIGKIESAFTSTAQVVKLTEVEELTDFSASAEYLELEDATEEQLEAAREQMEQAASAMRGTNA